jgi:hypothetical protein
VTFKKIIVDHGTKFKFGFLFQGFLNFSFEMQQIYLPKRDYIYFAIVVAENTKGGSITVLLTSCLTVLD